MKTVLIVDDEERIRKTYKNVFLGENYIVFEAANALEAHDILEFNNVDLMLLDINMPKVNGTILYDAAKLLKMNIKIIISSVYPLDEQKQLIEFADDYFDKSEGIKKLKEKVKKLSLKKQQK